MAKTNAKSGEHASGCKSAKAVFGLLFLLVGIYAILKDLGAVSSSVSFWSLLVFLAGLMWLLKALGSGKCPACR